MGNKVEMIRKIKYILVFILGFTLCSASSNVCRGEKIERSNILKTVNLYSQVIEHMESNNIELAFIGRKGLENKYVEYTHIGIIWKDGDQWKVTDLLQPCEDKKPLLYDEGVGEFFLYSKVSTVKLLIPSEKTRKEFKEAVKNREIELFLGERYSLVANAWETKYQNCTQFVLEAYSYIASDKTVKTRKEAIAWYRKNGYKPEKLKVSFIVRNVARLHKVVALDDHKNKESLEIVTVNTIFDFVKKMEPESYVLEFIGMEKQMTEVFEE